VYYNNATFTAPDLTPLVPFLANTTYTPSGLAYVGIPADVLAATLPCADHWVAQVVVYNATHPQLAVLFSPLTPCPCSHARSQHHHHEPHGARRRRRGHAGAVAMA
jgi:hypothetical protein